MVHSYWNCHEEKLLNLIKLVSRPPPKTAPDPLPKASILGAERGVGVGRRDRALWLHSKSPFLALALLWPLMTSYCALIANQGTRNDQAASLSPYSDDNGQSGQLTVLT